MATSQAGWFEDPTGRAERRYWDGNMWTEHVASGTTRSTDPIPQGDTASASESLASSARTRSTRVEPADSGRWARFRAVCAGYWRAFRRWPIWAQVLIWVGLALVSPVVA